MAIIEENITEVNSTPAQVVGGIPVSTGPDPIEEKIKQAREQIYKTLGNNRFTFEEFSAELDDPEYGEQIVKQLSKNSKLKGWNYETLRAALFEGKSNEVSSPGSEVTSETSQEPSPVSQNSSVVTEVPADPNQPLEVNVTGTWREGFGGRFVYDAEGYEVYEPTPEAVANLGGWDNVRAFFEKEHPNTIVVPPTDSFVTDTSQYINYETARPADIDALRKERELQSKPFSEWDQEDKTDYFLSNIVINNTQQGNSVTDEEVELRRIQAAAEQDEAESTGFLGSMRDIMSSGVRAFGSGATRVGADVLGIVPFLHDVVADIVNTPSFRETYGQTFIQDAQQYLRGAINRDELYNRHRFSDQGVVESFQSGNVENGINKLVSGVTNSLPIMLSLTAGNASGLVTTLSMGAGQYDTLQESNPNMDRGMQLLNSTLNMYAEMIPERIGADAVFKPFYTLFQKSGREVAENALSKFLRKYTGQFGALTPAVVEGSTEAATAVMQNLIAKYSGEDPDRKLNEGLADAILIGSVAGGAIASPAQLANSVINKSNRQKVETLATENRDIEITLNNKELDPILRDSLTEKYLKNVNEINSYIEQEVERKGSLSARQRAIVDDLEARKSRMSKLIDNPEVPETVQKGAQEDVETINNEIEKVLEQSSEEQTVTETEQVDIIENEENIGEDTEEDIQSSEVVSVGQSDSGPQELVSEESEISQPLTRDDITYTQTETLDGQTGELSTTEQSEIIDTLKSDQSFLSRLTDGEQRSSRIQQLEDRLKSNLQADQNLGINQDPRERARRELEFLRDLTEYAVLKIADGTVKTAKAFQDLARGLGNFGDEVLNRAYYNAQDIAQSYVDTNPELENIDQATGEVLQRMQDITVDRTKAKTKVTSSTVRDIVDGGTRGTITQSIRKANQEYYATLQRGARIGQKAMRDAAKQLRKEVKAIVRETFKNSTVPIAKALSDKDIVRLANKVASTQNEKSLQEVADFLETLASKAEYVDTFARLTKLRNTAKQRSRSERLPVNIRDVFGEFSRIGASDLLNKGLLTPANMTTAQSILDRLADLEKGIKPGEQYKGNITDLAQLRAEVKDFADKIERMRFREELPSLVEHLTELTQAAGGKFDPKTDTPKSYRDYYIAVDTLETTIQQQNLPDQKTQSRTRYAAQLFVEQNVNLLDQVDLNEFTPNEQQVIEDMKLLDEAVLDQMSDADVVKLSIALPNIINNGRLDGIGSAVAKANAYRLAMDKSFTDPVKKAALEVPALGELVVKIPGSRAKSYTNLAKAFASTSQRLDALFKDMLTKGKFLGKFGIQAYKEGRNVAQRLYEKAQKDFGDLVERDKDVREFLRAKDRGVREIKLGIYAWLNQNEAGLSVEERDLLYAKKKDSLRKMLDMLDPAGTSNRILWDRLRDNKAYYENVRKAIREVLNTRSIAELSSRLGKGESKVYARALEMFESLRPEFIANARLYNNVDLDTNIENYTPINYEFFAEVSDDVLLDTSYNRAFSSVKISGRSGSGSAKERIIKDGSLPRNGILDFNFITNTFKNYGLQLADIHTQGQRMQIHHNLANVALREATGGLNLFKSVGDMMTEEMMSNYGYFSSPRAMNVTDKLKRSLLTAAYGRALGGIGQALKQFIPMVTDAMIRTGDLQTMATYWSNAGKIAKFISDQDIARRGVQSSQMGSSVTNDLEVGDVSNSTFRTLESALDAHDKVINKWVLGPLRMGDVHGARMSWMMYYNQYAHKNGIPVDLDGRPDPEAAAYADNMVDITGNTSVDSNKAKATQSMWAKMFFPFSGAALTSLVNMGVNTSKLITAIQTKDVEAGRQALNAMLANSAAITMFQFVGFAMRYSAISGLATLGEMAIQSIDLDDDEEEERIVAESRKVLDDYITKRAYRNMENSLWYWTNDIVHRGLLSQGPLEPVSEAVLKRLFGSTTGITISNYRTTDPNEAMFNAFGVYGIVPAGIYNVMNKNSSLFSDPKEEMRESGYGAFLKADGTYGFKDIEGKSMPQNVRVFQKAMNILAVPAMFGIQDQMVSTITRTTPQLYKQLEKVVYKGVPKVSDINSTKEFDNKFKTLNYKGKKMKLDSSEEKLFRRAYEDAYKESYKAYVEANEPLFGKGPKLEQLAAKHIYKRAKEKLLQNEEFRKLWEVKAEKNK